MTFFEFWPRIPGDAAWLDRSSVWVILHLRKHHRVLLEHIAEVRGQTAAGRVTSRERERSASHNTFTTVSLALIRIMRRRGDGATLVEITGGSKIFRTGWRHRGGRGRDRRADRAESLRSMPRNSNNVPRTPVGRDGEPTLPTGRYRSCSVLSARRKDHA
jgi:hypothetical protein